MPENVAPHAHPATTWALVLFTLISLGLGVVANMVASSRANFLRKYFLGNRSLGEVLGVPVGRIGDHAPYPGSRHL